MAEKESGKTRITITGADLLELGDALGPLAEHLINAGAVLLAYDLGLLRRTIRKELASLQDVRNGLVAKYGEPLPGVQGYRVPQGTEAWEQYTAELDPLLEKEFSFSVRKLLVSPRLLRGIRGPVWYGALPILDLGE